MNLSEGGGVVNMCLKFLAKCFHIGIVQRNVTKMTLVNKVNDFTIGMFN